jgi:hypothetical protein
MMMTITSKDSISKGRFHVTGLRAVALIMSTIILAATGGGLVYASGSAATQLYNVQIFVSTAEPAMNYYYLTAYNSTGGEVAQSQSQYPGFGLELPAGTYLFTVTAVQQVSQPPCQLCMGPLSSVSPSGASSTMIPVRTGFASEYGYVMEQVNGPTTINIQTQNVYNITRVKVAINVNFMNGTPAQGAYVYAYVVGEGYYYFYFGDPYVMYTTTNSSGVAVLSVPSLPVEVYAWLWVPVNIPKNVTTIQTTVGGEPVNVTVYWQPTSVGLAGTALIFPPTREATITLKVQRQEFWAQPLAAQSGVSGQSVLVGGESNSSQGAPAAIYNQISSGAQQYVQPGGPISQLPGTGGTQSSTGFSFELLLAAATAVIAFVVLFVYFIRRR